MLIDESRDTLKKYVLGLIVANGIATIALIFTVVLFAAHIWTGAIIAYAITCIMISINIGCFVNFYDKLKK